MKDPIERQEVMDAIYKCKDVYVNNLPIMIYKAKLYKAILELPSAETEMNFDEWCTDCKEYDHEKHCCPRWNRVIRQALKDAQPEIIECKDCRHRGEKPISDGRYWCNIHDSFMYYCSDGERWSQ